jgi:hypothetical protein
MSQQAPPLDSFKKKLTVLSLKELHRGRSKNGEWVMYEVEALDEAGKRVDQAAGGVPLRAFDGNLPLNELVEYEVQPKDTERHGRTYTIKVQRPPLWQRVESLEKRVVALEERMSSGQKSQPQSQDPAPAEVPADVPATQTQTW